MDKSLNKTVSKMQNLTINWLRTLLLQSYFFFFISCQLISLDCSFLEFPKINFYFNNTLKLYFMINPPFFLQIYNCHSSLLIHIIIHFKDIFITLLNRLLCVNLFMSLHPCKVSTFITSAKKFQLVCMKNKNKRKTHLT